MKSIQMANEKKRIAGKGRGVGIDNVGGSFMYKGGL